MLFSTKLGQEIRPMAELNYKRIEALPTDGKEGLGGGGGGGERNFFLRAVIAVMVKARGRKRGNACYFIRTIPWGDENDWLLKERLR